MADENRMGIDHTRCFDEIEAGESSCTGSSNSTSSTGKAVKKKRQERWTFTDEMVNDVLAILLDTKVNMEGQGLDFEGDLIKLYSELRASMAEKHAGFGPTETSQPEIEINEMSKEQYKAFEKKVDEEEKAIKQGYERIKAKVKKLRSGFQKAVVESTRSGSGRIIKDNWDTLIEIWGGAPGAEPLDFGVNTMEDKSSENVHQQAEQDMNENEKHNTWVDDDDFDDDDMGPTKQKKQKCATARFVDEKRKKLEKKLSSRQKESLILETMREDVVVKKKLLAQTNSSTSSADVALVKIAESMQTLSQAILSGFQHFNSFAGPSNQFAHLLPRQPQCGPSSFRPSVYPNSNQPQPFTMQPQFTGRPNSSSSYGLVQTTPSPSNTIGSWDEERDQNDIQGSFYQL